jgi:hypothetical protein
VPSDKDRERRLCVGLCKLFQQLPVIRLAERLRVAQATKVVEHAVEGCVAHVRHSHECEVIALILIVPAAGRMYSWLD